jgi:hypothetical protein
VPSRAPQRDRSIEIAELTRAGYTVAFVSRTYVISFRGTPIGTNKDYFKTWKIGSLHRKVRGL